MFGIKMPEVRADNKSKVFGVIFINGIIGIIFGIIIMFFTSLIATWYVLSKSRRETRRIID